MGLLCLQILFGGVAHMAATNTYEYLRCNLSTIEEIIGYRFQDRNLLIQALTSKSFGAENPSFEDNDVLEFYGDAELYKFLSDWLFDSFTVYPDGKCNNQLTSKKTVGELSEIRKYKQFKTGLEKGYNYEKDELILKLIALVIDKFIEKKENALVKCFVWVKKILQENLEIKLDSSTFKNLEKMKESKPGLKMKLGWMEEYSLLNKEEEIYKLTRKTLQKYSSANDKAKESKNRQGVAARRNTLNPELLKSGIMNRINEDLLDFESPNFNIFKLEEKVGRDNILPVTTTYVFASLGLFSIIDYTKFEPFIFRVASGYHRQNPYHTDLHAADMVQSLLVYSLYGSLQKLLDFNDLDLISLFISAAIHDFGHPGYTNNFLINTKNELAIKYNDQSVLENYHVSEGFNIVFKKKGCNIFESLSSDDYKICRKRIIQCVLATDMTLHNKEFQFLKSKSQTYNIKDGENVEKIFENIDPVTSFNLRQEFLNVLIHSADVSNPTKPLDIYKQWATRCVEEFFKQGDMEKRLGMPVSFNCDRDTVSLPQSQVGFIDAIVFPLFSVICEYFPGLKFTLENLGKNLAYFKGVKENENKKKIKEEIKEEDEFEKEDKKDSAKSSEDDNNSVSSNEEDSSANKTKE